MVGAGKFSTQAGLLGLVATVTSHRQELPSIVKDAEILGLTALSSPISINNCRFEGKLNYGHGVRLLISLG